MKRIMLLLTLLLIAAPGGRAAPALQAPVLKWQRGGCTSWCETGWYSSAVVGAIAFRAGGTPFVEPDLHAVRLVLAALDLRLQDVSVLHEGDNRIPLVIVLAPAGRFERERRAQRLTHWQAEVGD